jgi:prepilin-type N-terminal cleavage/methylation domain-containing protein
LSRAFTIAELLIALAIMGLLAAITIPKFLMVDQGSQNKTKSRQVAEMIAVAYMAYQQDKVVTSAMPGNALTPYFNYLRVDTTSTLDGGSNCFSSDWECVRLHNGGTLQYAKLTSFGGTASTNAMAFCFDPDGVQNGQGLVVFWLFYDGRVKSWGNIPNNTCNSYACGSAVPDPTWFNWN